MNVPTPTIVIPAAGEGVRLRTFGPKALFKLPQETILARQVRLLRARFPEAPIRLTVGFEARKLRRALKKVSDITLLENPDYATTGTAHSIQIALADIEGPVLLVYGDLVFSERSLENLSLGTDSVLYGETSLLRSGEVGLTVDEYGEVGVLSHGLPVRWAQVALLQDKELFFLSTVMATHPHSSRYFFYEALNHAIELGGVFQYKAWPGWLVEVDTSKDIGAARLAVSLEGRR